MRLYISTRIFPPNLYGIIKRENGTKGREGLGALKKDRSKLDACTKPILSRVKSTTYGAYS